MKTLNVNIAYNENEVKYTQILGFLESQLAFSLRKPHAELPTLNVSLPFEQIREWAKAKGIYAKGDPKTQTLKLGEEFGELSKAILNNDRPEIIDAIGDCVVVLVSIAKLNGLNIEDCIESAYNVIANRKGKMENGTFVKE